MTDRLKEIKDLLKTTFEQLSIERNKTPFPDRQTDIEWLIYQFEKAVKVIEFYGNENNWYPVIINKNIKRLTLRESEIKKARDFLEGLEK